jgi:hypothetical protein
LHALPSSRACAVGLERINLTAWARTPVSSKIRDVDLVKNEWIREIEN